MTQPVTHDRHPCPQGATGGLVTPATPSIRLAGEHFSAATLYLIAGAIGLVWIAPELAAGILPLPHVAGVTHLFTLGWLTTTIFGALYQLLARRARCADPVTARRPSAASGPSRPVQDCLPRGIADEFVVLHHIGLGTRRHRGRALLGVTTSRPRLPRARDT